MKFSLRVALHLKKLRREKHLPFIDRWVEELGRTLDVQVKMCIFLSDSSSITYIRKNRMDLCLHVLDLPISYRKYLKGERRFSNFYSPWGNKSGPNLQFWLINKEMRNHKVDWFFLLEDDVHLVNPSKINEFSGLFFKRGIWMIGNKNHPKTLQALSNDLLNRHINGSAFYRIGDDGYWRFLRRVWIPALINEIKVRPNVAFDLFTSPDYVFLNPIFHKDWVSNQHRFVSVFQMQNLSNLAKKEAESLLRYDLSIKNDSERWFSIHSKYNPGWFRDSSQT